MDNTRKEEYARIVEEYLAKRDRDDPSIYEAFLVAPQIYVDKASQDRQNRDMQRGWRRYLLPSLRIISRALLIIILSVKRIVPFNLGSERMLNRLGVWFMGKMISPEALEYIIRHFHIETSLINFVARNCDDDNVQEVNLRPLQADDLGDVDGVNAIIRHDINIYNLILDVGYSKKVQLKAKPLAALDFSPLFIGDINIEADRKRIVNFDLDTAIYIMVVFLGIFLTDKDIERAVTSLQFDESLLATIASITGDDQFRYWTPMKFTNWLGSTSDIVRDLRWHMMVAEYAYNRLLESEEKQ